MSAGPFVYHHRVRYHECDAQGVVFNAHYLTFLDVALTELFRSAMGSLGEVNRLGYDTMVVDAHVAWKSPAKFDDEVAVALEVTRYGRTSMATRFTQSVGERLCAEGEIVHVWVDVHSHAPIPVPDVVRAALAPFTAAR
ncbi:MAG TPA: thioesterase family protein [Ilumatobacter sp.]|nr:thioesterase family protein [Ilumatobacter sp.]